MLHLKLQKQYFDSILAGAKTVEGRLAKHKFFQLQTGDIIIFSQDDISIPPIECQVLEIAYFRTFKEMLENIGLSKILPQETSIENGIAVYRQFYSENNEKIYGVLAMTIQVIKK